MCVCRASRNEFCGFTRTHSLLPSTRTPQRPEPSDPGSDHCKSVPFLPATESLALDRYVKYPLMDDAFERVFTIGFRCAYDRQ